jgi:hypothetical protein
MRAFPSSQPEPSGTGGLERDVADHRTEGGRRARTRWLLGSALLVLAVVGALVGVTVAAPILFQPGGGESGQGAYSSQTALTYWTWQSSSVSKLPGGLGAASTTVGTPTVLTRLATGTTSYRLTSATAGNLSLRWSFSLTTTAPTSVEFELRFTVGISASPVTLRVYLETPATAPGAALPFSFYWDLGSSATSSFSIAEFQVVSLQCAAIGNCP